MLEIASWWLCFRILKDVLFWSVCRHSQNQFGQEKQGGAAEDVLAQELLLLYFDVGRLGLFVVATQIIIANLLGFVLLLGRPQERECQNTQGRINLTPCLSKHL